MGDQGIELVPLPAKVLSPEEDQQLRGRVTQEYMAYLNSLLGPDVTSCSGQIFIPYGLFIQGDTAVDQSLGETLGEMKPAVIPDLLLTVEDVEKYLEDLGILFMATEISESFRNQKSTILDSISNSLNTCTKRYFLLSTRIVLIGNYVGHQTILLFDREKKECVIIEPKFPIRSVVKLYKQLLERLGKGKEYTLIEPNDQCVQAIAKDRNCMYWSLLLVTKYIQGSFPTIDAVSRSILAQKPTADDLRKMIETFKYKLFHKNGPSASIAKGGKRWATSMANRSRRRHLRRHRQPKTSSRSLRNARRTRRRM
jgi:hypothetical protein